MAESYYAIGHWANMIRDASQITVSSENSLFKKDHLVAREPGIEFRFAAAAADDSVTIDLSLLLNPGFQTWTLSTVPDHFEDISKGTGALEQETGGDARTGSSALRLNGGGGGNEAISRQRFKVMAGWAGNIETYVKSNDASPVIVRIRLLETGQWLDSAGAWQATSQDWESNNSASYVQQTGTITIPESSSSRYPVMTLEVEIRYEGSGLGYADDFGIWFDWDLAAVLGNNLATSIITPRFEKSTDNVSYSTEVDATIAVPSFYVARPSVVSDRYLRLKAIGTNHEPIRYGELFVTKRRSHTIRPSLPYPIIPRLAKTERQGVGGRPKRIAKEEHASENHSLVFRNLSASLYRELYDNVLRAGEWGAAPGIVAMDSTRDEVIHATFGEPSIERTRSGLRWTVSIPFEASAYNTRTK